MLVKMILLDLMIIMEGQAMTKVALIIGVTGQGGAYLAEFLLGKGYEVNGMKRRSSLFNNARIDHNGLFIENHHYPIPGAFSALSALI